MIDRPLLSPRGMFSCHGSAAVIKFRTDTEGKTCFGPVLILSTKTETKNVRRLPFFPEEMETTCKLIYDD